jgi:hypothetical protein
VSSDGGCDSNISPPKEDNGPAVAAEVTVVAAQLPESRTSVHSQTREIPKL